MKKIHVLICMIALLSVTSCVNLDLNPPSAASSENWFSSPEEVRISLNDFYRSTFFVIEEGWNALELQADWFKEQRRDIFMQRNNIPTSTGFRKTPWANYGKVNNTGIDLSLTYNKQFNKDLHVGFRGTFTYAHNEIIEMDEAMGVIGTNRQRTGRAVNELFGLVAERLFTEDDFTTNEKGDLVRNWKQRLR